MSALPQSRRSETPGEVVVEVAKREQRGCDEAGEGGENKAKESTSW